MSSNRKTISSGVCEYIAIKHPLIQSFPHWSSQVKKLIINASIKIFYQSGMTNNEFGNP